MTHLVKKLGHLMKRGGHLAKMCCGCGCPTQTCSSCTIPLNATAVVSNVIVPVCQSPAACDDTDARCDEIAGGDTSLAMGTCPEGCVCGGGSGGGTPCPNCSHRYYFPAADGIFDGKNLIAPEPVVNGIWDLHGDGVCDLTNENCAADLHYFGAIADSCCAVLALCGGDEDHDDFEVGDCIHFSAYVDPADGKFVVIIYSTAGDGPDNQDGNDPIYVFFYARVDCPASFPTTIDDDTDYPVGSCIPGTLFGYPLEKLYKVASGGSITITCAGGS
jgi:hypothetical protein